jgi:putative nucleotidyltransferase with HDIG domain
MKNNLPKISFLPLSIGFVIFIMLFLADLLVSTFSLDVSSKLIVFLIVSLLLGIFLYNGFFIFIPVFKESVMALRQMYRFESLSHPLLLKLSYEAPGTYHHSMNVSILSQKAAKAIGADTLLVRLGAYYHDLGKLESPMHFIENQSGSEIPHAEDAESIRRDANKIISHVKKGVEIARENHLPEEVVNLIAQHHGTTRVLYFYEKAKERGLKIKKTDFRYAGPTPQTKEAVILMFSDSAEAAARAIINLTEEKIREIIANVIEDKISEGQVDNTNLSRGDLTRIKESLIETLGSIYHQRILDKDE